MFVDVGDGGDGSGVCTRRKRLINKERMIEECGWVESGGQRGQLRRVFGLS